MGKSLVNNSLDSRQKLNFSFKDYVVWHNKVHNVLKVAGKVMITKRNIDAFLVGINNPQLKDSITEARSQLQFLDDYNATANFIKYEVCCVHKFNSNNHQPWNVVVIKSGGRHASGRGGHRKITVNAKAEYSVTVEDAVGVTTGCPKTYHIRNERI